MADRKRQLPAWMLTVEQQDASRRGTATVTPSGHNRITKYFSPVKASSEAGNGMQPEQVYYIISPAELEAVAQQILAAGE